MVTKLKAMAFGWLLALPLCGTAQLSDSTVSLREVVVEQSRLSDYAISRYELNVDSTTLRLAGTGNLADLLRKFGYGHLRAYGPGGLATASFRGTGSSHTAVLWNGINLLSPLSGQLDMSHIPVSFMDDASIQTGGNASLYGNGAIGGTIHLNNTARFNEGLNLQTYASAGSFGSYYQDAGVKWSSKKFISSTKVLYGKSENDFEYTTTSKPYVTKTRQHTASEQKGILQQNYWQLSAQHLLTLKLWLQDNRYEVPNATSVTDDGQAVERNKYYRAVAGWNFNHEKFDLHYQSAFVKHDLFFSDPAIQVNSVNTFNTLINNGELNYKLVKTMTATSGINYTWEEGVVDDFGDSSPQRNRFILFHAMKWVPSSRYEVSLGMRQELINGSATPFAPSLTATIGVLNGLDFYGSFSRSYRVPTFNDLYWKGSGAAGNPDLKSEVSLSGEAGLRYTSPAPVAGITLSSKATVFDNHVDDWILWSPVAGNIWTPKNVKEVRSRGVEAQVSAATSLRKISFELSAQYTFTRSTNEDIYNNTSSSELGKQLILTPQHEGSVTARIGWKGYQLNGVVSYTGKQYVDGDNNEFYALKDYTVVNLWFNKTLTIKNLALTALAEVNNLSNTSYLSRPGYPMPGRNYKIGIIINFNKRSTS